MGISLTAGMRSNLINLQNTAKLMDQTSIRLNSGKKVNSALDDPISFFTAKNHMSRASNLGTLKNGMSEGIQTITAANNGIESIISLIEAAKSKAESAKSASLGGKEYATSLVSLDTVTAGDTIVIGGVTFTAKANAAAVTANGHFSIEGDDGLDALALASAVTSALTAQTGGTAGTEVAAVNGGTVTFENSTANLTSTSIVPTDTTFTETLVAGTGDTAFKYGTVDMVNVTAGDIITIGTQAFTAAAGAQSGLSANQFSIDGDDAQDAMNLGTAVTDAVNAGTVTAGIEVSGVNGSVVSFENTTQDVTSSNITSTDTASFTEAVKTPDDWVAAGALSERAALVEQFETLMSQIDQMQGDAGYKGTNLLKTTDTLSVKFEGSNKLDVTGFDGTLSGLGLFELAGNNTSSWNSDDLIDTDIALLDAAVATLESKSSSLASSLSIVTTRQDFTENMINTLTTGADNLTLADMNEEGANMLMLQTQQALGTNSLSLAAQTAQGVLRLF